MSVLALAGCLTTSNDRLALGRSSASSTGAGAAAEAAVGVAPPLDPTSQYRPAEFGGPSTALPAEATASVTGVSRADWPLVEVLVPVDGVGATPAYAPRRTWGDRSIRAGGDFPTALSALDVTPSPWSWQALEAVAGPFYAAYDLAAMPVRMAMVGPWEDVGHRTHDAWRAPVVIPRGLLPTPSAAPTNEPANEPANGPTNGATATHEAPATNAAEPPSPSSNTPTEGPAATPERPESPDPADAGRAPIGGEPTGGTPTGSGGGR